MDSEVLVSLLHLILGGSLIEITGLDGEATSGDLLQMSICLEPFSGHQLRSPADRRVGLAFLLGMGIPA